MYVDISALSPPSPGTMLTLPIRCCVATCPAPRKVPSTNPTHSSGPVRCVSGFPAMEMSASAVNVCW